MTNIEYVDGSVVEPSSVPVEVADHVGISQVLAWVAEDPAAREIVDSVTQDEYTHDFVVALRDEIYLAYAVT